MRFLLLGVLAVLSLPVAAWNDTGHLVAALAAYDAMAPDVRARLNSIVRAHPRFRADFEARRPRSLDDADPSTLDRWYFGFASTWPDVARRFGHVASRPERERLVSLYHRGRWHFVNLPTFLAPNDARVLADRGDVLEATRRLAVNDLDIVRALGRLVRLWSAGDTTDTERGLALAWIGHLVADLHQPLHATALFAVGVLADGDRGGNLLVIPPDGNLHALWDGGIGSGRRQRDLERRVSRLPDAGTVSDPFDFAAWAHESQRIAEREAYSPAIRRAVEARRGQPGPVPIAVDAAYLTAMKERATHRIATASRRLAALLTALVTGAPEQ